MIRLYRYIVQLLLGILLVAKEHLPEAAFRELFRRLQRDYGHSEVVPETLDEMITLLNKVLNTKGTDDDLINNLVRALGLPYNTGLTSKSLSALKKAIMDPSEIAALDKELFKSERHCMFCGRKLRVGELLVLREHNGRAQLGCLTCATPDYLGCAKGRHVNKVGPGLIRSLQKNAEHCTGCEKGENELLDMEQQEREEQRWLTPGELVELAGNGAPPPPVFRAAPPRRAGVPADRFLQEHLLWGQGLRAPRGVQFQPPGNLVAEIGNIPNPFTDPAPEPPPDGGVGTVENFTWDIETPQDPGVAQANDRINVRLDADGNVVLVGGEGDR